MCEVCVYGGKKFILSLSLSRGVPAWRNAVSDSTSTEMPCMRVRSITMPPLGEGGAGTIGGEGKGVRRVSRHNKKRQPNFFKQGQFLARRPEVRGLEVRDLRGRAERPS